MEHSQGMTRRTGNHQADFIYEATEDQDIGLFPVPHFLINDPEATSEEAAAVDAGCEPAPMMMMVFSHGMERESPRLEDDSELSPPNGSRSGSKRWPADYPSNRRGSMTTSPGRLRNTGDHEQLCLDQVSTEQGWNPVESLLEMSRKNCTRNQSCLTVRRLVEDQATLMLEVYESWKVKFPSKLTDQQEAASPLQ